MWRFVLCILTLFTSIRSAAYRHSQIGDGLYTFTNEGKYGVCTRDKKVVVPAQYFYVVIDGAYCIAESDSGLIDVWSRSGKMLVSGRKVTKINDSSLVVFMFNDPTSYDKLDRYSRRGSDFFSPDSGQVVHAWLLTEGAVAESLPGRVIKYRSGHCIIESGGSMGVIALPSRRAIVPLTWRKVKEFHGFYLARNDSASYALIDRQGETHKAPTNVGNMNAISPDGRFFMKDSGLIGSNVSYFNPDGKLLYKGSGMYVPDKHLDDIPSVYIRRGRAGNCYLDTLGNLLPDVPRPGDAPTRGDVSGHIYIAMQNPPDSMRYKMPAKPIGIYNAKTKQYVMRLPTDGQAQIWRAHSIVFSSVGGVVTAWDGNGNEIMKMPLGFRDMRYDSDYVRDYFGVRALRNDAKGKFMVYNASMTKKHRQLFDNVARGANNWEFAGKINGKWGIYRIKDAETSMLFDANSIDTFAEVIPPIYEAIAPTHGGLYHVTQQGKTFWLDERGKKILGGKPFEYVMEANNEGSRLVIEMTFNSSVGVTWDKIMLVDTNGKVIGSLVPPSKDYYWRCYPYSGDRVLCYTTDGIPVIWHARTGVITKLPMGQAGGIAEDEGPVASTDSGPIAIIIENEKLEQGVYSLLEEKIIVPLGKYRQLRYHQYNRTSVAFMTNPFSDPRILVIYDENGQLY